MDSGGTPIRATGAHCTARRARDLVEGCPDEPLTVTGLCEALHVSRGALKREFLEVYGISPLAFLRLRRLNGARRAAATRSWRWHHRGGGGHGLGGLSFVPVLPRLRASVWRAALGDAGRAAGALRHRAGRSLTFSLRCAAGASDRQRVHIHPLARPASCVPAGCAWSAARAATRPESAAGRCGWGFPSAFVRVPHWPRASAIAGVKTLGHAITASGACTALGVASRSRWGGAPHRFLRSRAWGRFLPRLRAGTFAGRNNAPGLP
jgi:AraC-like DNA-binding protein